jgi:hypothetical protein
MCVLNVDLSNEKKEGAVFKKKKKAVMEAATSSLQHNLLEELTG